MSKDSTAQADLNQQTNGFAVLIDWPVAFLCALAGFPYSAFKLIQNRKDKVNVLVRGSAVVISPLVGALSLWAYATVILGNAPFIMVLPLIAFLIDWLNSTSAYDNNGISRAMWWLRAGLALISLVIAGYSALLSEQQNLLREQNNHERQLALHDPVISVKNDRINELNKVFAKNELQIHGRTELVLEKTKKTKLADKECSGAAGVDEATGVKIAGGQLCGKNAKNHRLDATAAQAQIDEIDNILVPQNELLKQEIATMEKEREELINSKRSDQTSGGSLLQSLQYAKLGVILQVLFRLAILLYLELLALLLAHTPVSQNLRDIVGNVTTDDAQRIRAAHKASTAAILAEQAKTRALFGANLTPVIVRIPTAPQPTHTQTPLHSVKNESEGESKHG
jgi:hypothetical protein